MEVKSNDEQPPEQKQQGGNDVSTSSSTSSTSTSSTPATSTTTTSSSSSSTTESSSSSTSTSSTTSSSSESTKQTKYAWVSMIDTNVTSVMGARVLSQSLSKHGSTADRIVICYPGVKDKAISMLKSFGWNIYVIDVNMYEKIQPYPDSLRRELVKILLFNFTKYTSVGYLSPQSMVTANIDHLFQCGETALCASRQDYHHQIYNKHQRHSIKLLSNDAVDDNQDNANVVESIFDDNLFLMSPETDLYHDIYTHITTSYDAKSKYTQFPSYLSEYFYHYCKGNGYPIKPQTGKYSPPKVSFNCTDSAQCKMDKEISKSPCYMLEAEMYNFHPSHNDHISSSWHWKQSMQHLAIKLIQYSSYNEHLNVKPWNWRYVMFNGWMIEWNEYAEIEPNLYLQFLLNDEQHLNQELIASLWQQPLLYLLFTVIWLLSCTALSTPIFNLFSVIIHKISRFSANVIPTVLMLYQWFIVPLLLIWNIVIIVNPIKRIFIDAQIIPASYPFIKAWLLALQHCYFITCLKFVIMCFVHYWLGNAYNPRYFKIKWFDYLQLQLFAFGDLDVKLLNVPKKKQKQSAVSVSAYKKQLKQRRQQQQLQNVPVWFTSIILKFQSYQWYILHDVLLKYVSILVLLILKWCLFYLICVVVVLSSMWILRYNDWHELKMIVGCECIIAFCWLCYSGISIYCQCFIYPQITKYGEKYYDSHAFEKGI